MSVTTFKQPERASLYHKEKKGENMAKPKPEKEQKIDPHM